MPNDKQPKHTPLYLEHRALKAHMVPFGEWEMPLQYAGILAEYHHCRSAASIFDTSHMGEYIISGSSATDALEKIVTQRLGDMPLKTCRYGCMLNDSGGIIDDLIAFRIEREKWMLVVNANTVEKDERHIAVHLPQSVTLVNVSAQLGKIDLQGPCAREVIKEMSPGIEKLTYYTFDYFSVLGENVIISRTGYTGELGYEIYFPADRIIKLWQMLCGNVRIKPAGLGARDVLRLEMGYSLYGQDIDETVSPDEAGLRAFVDVEKEFIGRTAVLKARARGVARKKIFFQTDSRRSPRHGYRIYVNGKETGSVTSGVFSPYLKAGIGMGFAAADADIKNGAVSCGESAGAMSVRVVTPPFYPHGSLRK